MGQLERYGLYVLCLVIFLILGVAMWGDGNTVAAKVGAGNGARSVAGLADPSDDNAKLRSEQDMINSLPKYLAEEQQRREKQANFQSLLIPGN